MKNYLHSEKFIQFFKHRLLLPVLLTLVFSSKLLAQGYISHSRVFGSSGNQSVTELIVEGGYSYILGITTGNNYPITLGSVPAGISSKSTLTKFDASGNLVWSRYLPLGSGNINDYSKMVLENGVLYLGAVTNSINVPVTNGSVGGGTSDIIFTKIDATNGAILHNAYLGGNGVDPGGIDMAVENGYTYITYLTGSSNIPVTTGPAFVGQYDRVVQKLDASGNMVYGTYTGNVSGSGSLLPISPVSLKVENGIAYMAFALVSGTANFISTDGSTVVGSNDIAVLRLDVNGNKTLGKILGGSGADNSPALAIHNGDIYLASAVGSTNFPVTDGSSRGSANGSMVLSRINSNGDLVFSRYLANAAAGLNVYNLKPTVQYYNGSVYAAMAFIGAYSMATTDGSTGSNALVKVDAATGATQFATLFGQNRPTTPPNAFTDMFIGDDGIYTTTPIVTPGSAFVTDGSTLTSPSGTFIARHALDGKLLYASFLTARTSSTTIGSIYHLDVENGKIYVSGFTYDAGGFPVTAPPLGFTTNPIERDLSWTVLEFCPPVPTTNNITPLSQSTCQGGLVQGLTGNEVVYPSSEVPPIYVYGTAREQMEIRPRYQWQSSTSSTGPWINIVAGTQRDYIPPTAAQTLYYRRLVLPPAGCGDGPVSISPVAEVVISANAAPAVTSDVFNTCVNSPVNISATVSGGTAPYTYAWDNGISSVTNSATVTPTANSVYTITVTDANGCQQIGQAIVNAYVADAGPATATVCAGNPVRIGAAPPAGLAGVTYSWTPIAGLDDPTAAQPLATPGVSTVYTLQMTIPVSGGGTCTTSDNITVNLQAGPTTPNFAGADQATCKGGTLNLGTAAEAGFTYTWTPGSYLSSATTSTTTFSAGTSVPQPNPYVFTLTAASNGCTFTDQVSVAVLDVDAGEEYCGPRTLGTADKTPGVTGKTYLWTIVSGPGTFTGPTNTPSTTVSASAGGNTTYRVTVSYLGASCSDDVVVTEGCSGGCPDVEIDTIANHGCPSAALGAVTLRANPSNLANTGWTYTWSSVPAGGLSATTGNTVTLTDNVERDVTVTVSRADNPAVTCSHTIHVNDPSWSLPVFNVPDQSVCSSTPVSIGAAAVAGYFYTWQNVSAGDIHASNPSVSPALTTLYPVTIDDVGSGCRTLDTVTVTVKPLIIDPGPDWVACSNALITLGTPAQPGYTYSWNPQVASYQNGTTYQSAMPQVLVATSQDFTLTVTDPETGCTDDSTVNIIIDENNTLPTMTSPTICAGGSTTIGMPALTGVTYSWSPATGLSGTTVAQPVANPTSTQVYTLTATYYDAGGAPACTKTGSLTVFVTAPQITMSDESICPSGSLYNLSTGVTVNGATTYSWSPAMLVTNPNALNTTVKSNPGTPTTFTLTATDANGCTSSASKVVSPTNTAPEAGSSGFVCTGSSKTLGAASNTGTLSWTVSPAIAGTLSPANGAEPVFTPALADAGKNFTFIITQDISGCINVDSVQVLVRGLILPAMPAQTVCMNAPATIGVTPQEHVTYSWTPTTGLTDPNAATTTVTSVTANSVYTLTAIDVYGCSATGNAAVGMNPVSAPTVNIPDVTAGVGTSGTPFAPQVSPMPADYAYSWSPADRLNNPYIPNATATPGAAGTYIYNLSVTDENGCTTTEDVQLNVVPFSTLPVKLSSFTANTNSCGVRLNWRIESFENFSRFIIERKGSNGDYKEIDVIYHDPSRSMYQFDDVDPGNGNWAYRLKLVDQDGKSTYSLVVLAKVNCSAGELLVVYPNPVNNEVYIKSGKPVRSVTLFSMTGKIIHLREYRQLQPGIILMPIETQLSQGIYFLRVVASDGTIQNTKLLKE
jgi:hypothetical protein